MENELSQEGRELLKNDIVNTVLAEIRRGSSGSQFQANVERRLSQQVVDGSNDGVSNVASEPVNVLSGVANAELADSRQQLEIANRNLENTYYQTTRDRQPVTPADVQNAFQNHASIQAAMFRNTPDYRDDGVSYRQGTFRSDGKVVKYQQKEERVNWGELIESKYLNPAEAVEELKDLYSREIKYAFGGWNRIQSIVVRDRQMIINNILFKPLINPAQIDKFPMDLSDCLINGAYAELFDWFYLREMDNLVLLDFDDSLFVASSVDTDLGCRGRVGVSTFFRICPILSTLIIEGQKSTRDSLYSSESREAKECIARGHRSINLTQGFNLNVCENTGRFQSWSFNNLRNYAVNRGDKGILRYMFGIGTRGMIATAGTAVNISTNLIKNVVDMFKYASS